MLADFLLCGADAALFPLVEQVLVYFSLPPSEQRGVVVLDVFLTSMQATNPKFTFRQKY